MLAIVVALQLASSAATSSSSAVASADDPVRRSWSTSSGAVAPAADARSTPIVPALIAGAVAGLGGGVGFLVGQAVGASGPPSSACATSCGGMFIGAAVGGVVGAGTAVVIDHDVNPLAIPAAGVAAPAGILVGGVGLAYVSFPFVGALAVVGAGSAIGESPLGLLLPVLSTVAVVGVGAGITAAVVHAMTARPVGDAYVATGEAAPPPPASILSPSSSSPLVPPSDPVEAGAP